MTDVTRQVFFDRMPGQRRTVLRLTGADTRRFLQGILTADIERLQPRHALASALLTAKGGLVSEVVVLPLGGDGVGLLVPQDAADEVVQVLERHVVMDEVFIERKEDLSVAFRWPAGTTVRENAEDFAAFETRHPAPGELVVGPSAGLEDRLGPAALASVTEYTHLRIATASPGWRHELRPGRLPTELGFGYAVSYDKGCFLGQEPLIRVRSRGLIHRVLVRIEATSPPVRRCRLRAAERERAGEWTSWAPTHDHVVGLALVHRDMAQPGQELETEFGTIIVVTSGPLGV